jgi:hypothetical protein
MASRMIARGRHVSTALLLWCAAVLLGVADVLASGVVPGRPDATRTTALVLAGVAGFMIGTTLLRGLGSLVAYVRIRQAMRAHAVPGDEQLHAEAQRGIEEIEAFLAEQHSHGA